MEPSKFVLLPEVAQKYVCTIEPKPVVIRPPVGDYRIDLRSMTIEQADDLYNAGSELLVLRTDIEKQLEENADHKRTSNKLHLGPGQLGSVHATDQAGTSTVRKKNKNN